MRPPEYIPVVPLLTYKAIGLPLLFCGDIVEVQQFLATRIKSEGPLRSFHAPVGMSRVLELTLRDKIQLEIEFWRNELLTLWRLDDGNAVTTRIDGSHRQLARPAIARTLRILAVLEFLLLDFSIEKSTFGEQMESWKSIPQLREAVNWDNPESLAKKYIPDSFVPGWSLSWPLLIIRAVAWSQIAWEQPYLWEAHSALKARQDHAASGNMQDREIKFLAYLIRFQSAPGQLARGTGDARFLDVAEQLRGEMTVLPEPEFRKDLITALGVVAHAHDFRNRALILEEGPEELKRVLAHEGYLKERPLTNFSSFWEECFPGSNGLPQRDNTAQKTWSYSRFFFSEPSTEDCHDRRKVLAEFRETAQKHVASTMCAADPGSGEPAEIAGYSFGRDHMDSSQLRSALSQSIHALVADTDKPPKFNKFFRWESVSVPDCFDAKKQETVIVVRLRDHIMARHMVYSRFTEADALDAVDKNDSLNPAWPLCLSVVENKDAVAPYVPGEDMEKLDPGQRAERFYLRVFGREKPNEANVKDEHRAWRLFEYLFLLGIREKFIQWTPTRPAENYCPTYLIGSILDVCYRIAPNCCVSFPVDIDGETVNSIRLPIIPNSTSADAPVVKAVARYVCAYAVNKLMATRLKSLRLGLQNLEKTKAGQFWRKAILAEYQANALGQFLGGYADNFLQTTDYVQFDKKIYPVADFVLPESTTPISDLKSLLDSHPRSEVILAGIDVGGTYTKFSLYKLTLQGERIDLRRWDLFPESFKIETGLKNEAYNSASPFCDRLLTEIDRQLNPECLGLSDIDAIGISWPGPVLNNSIREYSGILNKFRNTKGGTFTVDLRELMQLDIAGEMARLWQRRIGSPVPRPVKMMNDGDSHALGEIYRLMLQDQDRPASTQPGITSVLLKLGTGTAGAVARNGRLIDGLMEFGKLISNLAYEPNGKYPEGLANRYCSAKTLPALACAKKPHLSQLQPALTSVEVGLLAGLAGIQEELAAAQTQSDKSTGSEEQSDKKIAKNNENAELRVYALLYECGKIAVADQLPDAIDVAELSQLLEGNWAERDESRLTVENALGCVGEDAFDEIVRSVRARGIMRLEAMLQLEVAPQIFRVATSVPNEPDASLKSQLKAAPGILRHGIAPLPRQDDVKSLKDFAEDVTAPLSDSVIEKIRQMGQVAAGCVERLGVFIGDLASLLYSEHDTMSQLVLGGGVLSGDTGDVAIQCAKYHMAGYSHFNTLKVNLAEQTIEVGRPSSTETMANQLSHTASSAHIDHGTIEVGTLSSTETTANQPSDSASNDHIDPGTFGVAAKAAIELLIHRRLSGLDSIRTKVERLKLTEQLVLEESNEDTVKVTVIRREHRTVTNIDGSADDRPNELRLHRYSLGLDLVCGYLDRHGSNLGIIRTSATDEAGRRIRTYTRWTTQ